MDKEYGKMGVLPDGRKAIVRSEGRHGCSVLEIRPINPKDKVVKTIYENDKD